jgi:hypothetical protein
MEVPAVDMPGPQRITNQTVKELMFASYVDELGDWKWH